MEGLPEDGFDGYFVPPFLALELGGEDGKSVFPSDLREAIQHMLLVP